MSALGGSWGVLGGSAEVFRPWMTESAHQARLKLKVKRQHPRGGLGGIAARRLCRVMGMTESALAAA